MEIGRLVVLKDDRNLILGVDVGNILIPNTVYEIFEFSGQITLKPMSENCLNHNVGGISNNSKINTIVYSGLHLLTHEEYLKITK